MAQGKFAPMTSALLARKGEATPSVAAAQVGPQQIGSPGIAPVTVGFFDRPAKRALEPRVEPAPSKPPISKPTKKQRKPGMVRGEKRRVVLTVSQEEFERLGIAAVKKKLTRQELLREAVASYLGKTARQYNSCKCIADGESSDR